MDKPIELNSHRPPHHLNDHPNDDLCPQPQQHDDATTTPPSSPPHIASSKARPQSGPPITPNNKTLTINLKIDTPQQFQRAVASLSKLTTFRPNVAKQYLDLNALSQNCTTAPQQSKPASSKHAFPPPTTTALNLALLSGPQPVYDLDDMFFHDASPVNTLPPSNNNNKQKLNFTIVCQQPFNLTCAPLQDCDLLSVEHIAISACNFSPQCKSTVTKSLTFRYPLLPLPPIPVPSQSPAPQPQQHQYTLVTTINRDQGGQPETARLKCLHEVPLQSPSSSAVLVQDIPSMESSMSSEDISNQSFCHPSSPPPSPPPSQSSPMSTVSSLSDHDDFFDPLKAPSIRQSMKNATPFIRIESLLDPTHLEFPHSSDELANQSDHSQQTSRTTTTTNETNQYYHFLSTTDTPDLDQPPSSKDEDHDGGVKSRDSSHDTPPHNSPTPAQQHSIQ